MNRLFIIIVCALAITSCSQNKDVIALQPFENFPTYQTKLIKDNLESTYGKKVIILPKIPLPKNTFINVKSPRYRADKLITYLKTNKPDSVGYIIGLTHKDISTTKKDKSGNVKLPKSRYTDWGVCGLGYRPGVSCIVSTFRIKHQNKAVSESRLMKLSSHEIGHNLGLHHCEHSEICVMRDAAESVSTIDKVNNRLCSHCKKEIE